MSDERNSAAWPAVAALSGSVMVGFMPLLARHLYAEGMGAPSMLLWRYLLAMAPLGLAIALMRLDLRREWRGGAWQIVLVGTTLGAAQTLCFWESIKTLDTSIAVLLFYTYPALTLALERLFLRRKIRAPAVACITVILCGAALITVPGLRGGGLDPRGLAWAIPSPVIYSIYLVVTSSLLRRHPPLIGASCLYLGLTITFAAGAVFTGLDWPASPETWWLLVVIALGPGALMITLFSYSAPRLGPSSYAIIANVELVTVVAIGISVLGERVSVWRAGGGAMIVGGIVSHSLLRRTPRPNPLSGGGEKLDQALAKQPSATGS